MVYRARKPHRPSLKDVAALAGVAQSTVSLYLNGKKQLTPTTSARIDAAIKKLKFKKSFAGEMLQTGRSSILGLMVPDLTNPFYSTLAENMSATAYDSGYSLLLCATAGEYQKERYYVELFSNGPVDGLIYIGGNATDPGLSTLNVPIIVVDEEIRHYPGAGVFVDNRHGAYAGTKHLIDLGHKKIGFVTGDPSWSTVRQRLQGFRDALKEHDITFSKELITEPNAVKDFLAAQAPTALFVSSDMYIAEVLRSAKALGKNVPEDLSLVGFDGILIAELVSPQITSIEQPIEQIAKTAVDKLVAFLTRATPLSTIVLPTKLVIRKSTERMKR